MPPLRLLSVNASTIPGGRAALIELIAGQDADLVCVHALPYLVRWRQAVGTVARRAGRVVVSGGGREAGSVLLLSSLDVDAGATQDVHFSGAKGIHPAGGSVARLRWHGTDLVLAGATLIGNSVDRLAQVAELHTVIKDIVPAEVATIISAEGTDRPGTAAWHALVADGVAVTGRVFVNDRVGVGQTRKLDGNSFTAPVSVELTLG